MTDVKHRRPKRAKAKRPKSSARQVSRTYNTQERHTYRSITIIRDPQILSRRFFIPQCQKSCPNSHQLETRPHRTLSTLSQQNTFSTHHYVLHHNITTYLDRSAYCINRTTDQPSPHNYTHIKDLHKCSIKLHTLMIVKHSPPASHMKPTMAV